MTHRAKAAVETAAFCVYSRPALNMEKAGPEPGMKMIRKYGLIKLTPNTGFGPSTAIFCVDNFRVQ